MPRYEGGRDSSSHKSYNKRHKRYNTATLAVITGYFFRYRVENMPLWRETARLFAVHGGYTAPLFIIMEESNAATAFFRVQ